jgi:hypothetical protein
MRRFASIALLVLSLPLCAAAQQPAGPAPSPGREDGRGLSPRVTPVFGLHYGSPLRISGTVGVVIDLNKRNLDGILLLVEPGQKGIEFSTGYLHTFGRFGSGLSVRASALHTYEDPWEANPQTTYLGGELHWMAVVGIGGRAGLFKRVTGTPGSHDTLGTLGFSIGL